MSMIQMKLAHGSDIPTLVCKACEKVIDKDNPGIFVWDRKYPGDLGLVTAMVVHKGFCDRAFDPKQERSSMEIRWVLEQLTEGDAI